MGSRKKPHSPDIDYSLQHPNKRVKAHYSHESSNESHPNEDRRNENAVPSRLVMLENLTREVLNNTDTSQECATAGADLLKAVAELDRAFRQAKKPSLATTPSEDIGGKSMLANDHSGLGNREGAQVPVLPPILDKSLEEAVFTHPGMSNDFNTTYDRLEILGDAYIELVATKLVWHTFPGLPSGRISQIRETLVKNETLAGYATMYGFDCRASVPKDYLKQPKRWMKTKGDIFEAYVAAVVLSDAVNGYSAVETWLTQLWAPKLKCLDHPPVTLQAKEALAKRIMGKGVKLKYVDERGPVQLEGGMQIFNVGVYLTGWGWTNKHLGSGQGLSKSIAGDQAARAALQNMSLIDEIAAVKKSGNAGKS